MAGPNYTEIHTQLLKNADPVKAAFFPRFFKTGKGEYGEGDSFLGVTVPKIRKVGREFRFLSGPPLIKLLRSRHHEERLLALLILVEQYRKGDNQSREQIFQLYIDNKAYVNNWDLVDSSAPAIVGGHLLGQPTVASQTRGEKVLVKMARSKRMWDRRIAMLACFYAIRAGESATALRIARLLRDDKEDLIHKAVGWMLREIGQRDRKTLRTFLDEHAACMPRTMLRYAIEKFPEPQRRAYLGMASTRLSLA